MIIFSLAKPIVTFKTLNQITDASLSANYLELITNWFTDEWGYLHDQGKTREQAVNDRKKSLAKNTDKIYLAFYGELVVGAFRVEDKEWSEELTHVHRRRGWQTRLKTSEIWFLYVDPACRSFGVGRQIVQKIKQLSKTEMGAHTVLLETLKPSLNRLYRTEGAEVICENHLNNHPTDVLSIKL